MCLQVVFSIICGKINDFKEYLSVGISISAITIGQIFLRHSVMGGGGTEGSNLSAVLARNA